MKLATHSFLSRTRAFWALSRTPHGVLDMTTPCFAALLWLGGFPPLPVVLLGAVTVFAGYTSVYALNDVVDFRVDQERLRQKGFEHRSGGQDIDAALIRHPLAQGVLSFPSGFFWAVSWGAAALTGAWLLNPVCAFIFIFGCALEAAYCLLFRVSPLRTLVNGVVKTLGSAAAVFAVDPNPSVLWLMVLFFTLFFWEIGGQNIPNDCADIEEDRRLKARTFPVCYGLDTSGFSALITLSCAIPLTLALLGISRLDFSPVYYGVVLGSGIALLILPALRFYKTLAPSEAMQLFNRASYYPVSLFAIVLIRLALGN